MLIPASTNAPAVQMAAGASSKPIYDDQFWAYRALPSCNPLIQIVYFEKIKRLRIQCPRYFASQTKIEYHSFLRSFKRPQKKPLSKMRAIEPLLVGSYDFETSPCREWSGFVFVDTPKNVKEVSRPPFTLDRFDNLSCPSAILRRF